MQTNYYVKQQVVMIPKPSAKSANLSAPEPRSGESKELKRGTFEIPAALNVLFFFRSQGPIFLGRTRFILFGSVDDFVPGEPFLELLCRQFFGWRRILFFKSFF